ncbi:MAG: DUF3301 domain-containing protein [Rhodanobacteraceae bacterium]
MLRSREDRDVLEAWLPLLGFAVIGWSWYHVLRLRERAVSHARQLCERHGLQLLDDSVSLHRLRANWRNGSLQVLREYRFDTSLDGHDRQGACITMRGDRVVSANMPEREPFSGIAPSPAPHCSPVPGPQGSGTAENVVSIRRARRTLH